jgi:hypothetical protein
MHYHSTTPFARSEMKEIDMERSRLTLIPIPNSKGSGSPTSVFYHFNEADRAASAALSTGPIHAGG